MHLLRRPTLHFLAGGALLFLLVHRATGPASAARPTAEPVVVDAVAIAELKRAYTAESGLDATDRDEAALVEKAIEEELLVREARARGLDRNDRTVRNWLVQQMRGFAGGGENDPPADDADLFARAQALGLDRTDAVVRRLLVQNMRLLAAREGERRPTDDELQALLAAHADDYRQPDRVTFWQAFLGSDATPDAADRLRAAVEGVPPADGVRHGRPFVVPAHLVAHAAPQLEKLFGRPFADAVLAAPAGRWLPPMRSSYGLHLVFVEQHLPGDVPPLDAVRGRLVERWLHEQRQARVAALVTRLRAQATLVVESDAWRAGHAS